MKKVAVHRNYGFEVVDGVLIIRVCVNEDVVDVQSSLSGQTLVLATTDLSAKVPDSPLRVNLTVYRKA